MAPNSWSFLKAGVTCFASLQCSFFLWLCQFWRIYKANHICFGCYQSIADEREITAPIYEQLIAGQLGFLGFFTCACTTCRLKNIPWLLIFSTQEKKRLRKKIWGTHGASCYVLFSVLQTLYLCFHTSPGCSGCAVPRKMPQKWLKGAETENWAVTVPVPGLG